MFCVDKSGKCIELEMQEVSGSMWLQIPSVDGITNELLEKSCIFTMFSALGPPCRKG